MLAVGIWAWTEKDTFNNLSRLTNIALDPAFILICVGESFLYAVILEILEGEVRIVCLL